MSEIKEIRNKINSLNSTKKITKAMEMVSIVKMKKSEIKMNSKRPYLITIKKIINNIIYNNAKYKHEFLDKRFTKSIEIIVISTDRGLCGNLNILLFKKIIQFIKNNKDKNVINNLFILGLKGASYFKSLSYNVRHYRRMLKSNYTLSDFLEFIQIPLQRYRERKIDKLFLAYNTFKSTLTHIPTIIQLLPLSQEKLNNNYYWDYIYESNSEDLLDTLLNDYIKFQIYQAILENHTCEQASRMIAMKQATDNSKDLIKQLNIIYNKARQDNITQELTEIVSGAAAVSLY
ncbi:MAG: ATP synthase F1 subunit gamma [Buchnera aphidicola (Schlechtendalia peitan)]